MKLTDDQITRAADILQNADGKLALMVKLGALENKTILDLHIECLCLAAYLTHLVTKPEHHEKGLQESHEVLDAFVGMFRVSGLPPHSNAAALEKQILEDTTTSH